MYRLVVYYRLSIERLLHKNLCMDLHNDHYYKQMFPDSHDHHLDNCLQFDILMCMDHQFVLLDMNKYDHLVLIHIMQLDDKYWQCNYQLEYIQHQVVDLV